MKVQLVQLLFNINMKLGKVRKTNTCNSLREIINDNESKDEYKNLEEA